jgi:hypothetical protein
MANASLLRFCGKCLEKRLDLELWYLTKAGTTSPCEDAPMNCNWGSQYGSPNSLSLWPSVLGVLRHDSAILVLCISGEHHTYG